MPQNFSWVVPGKIAGCGCPRSELELTALVGLGVTHLVTLSIDAPPPIAIKSIHKLQNSVIPIKEFKGPRLQEMIDFSKLVSMELSNGGSVAVHCRMGRGRTGTMLAAWFMSAEGVGAAEAMARVRRLRPGSVETREQEDALINFSDYLSEIEVNK